MKLIMRAAGKALYGISRMLVEVEQERYWPHSFDPGPDHRPMWEFVLSELFKLEPGLAELEPQRVWSPTWQAA